MTVFETLNMIFFSLFGKKSANSKITSSFWSVNIAFPENTDPQGTELPFAFVRTVACAPVVSMNSGLFSRSQEESNFNLGAVDV